MLPNSIKALQIYLPSGKLLFYKRKNYINVNVKRLLSNVINQNSKLCGGIEEEETVSYLNEELIIKFGQTFSSFSILPRGFKWIAGTCFFANRKSSILPVVILWSDLLATCCLGHHLQIIILKPKLFLVEMIWHVGV